ncbi:MAG: hypothetical protein GOV02_02880 [Candidatus Aenigmarchaeota archaeon]|nr:hypothetical protein [Candidatus Aenigmarchaeota archaeon]
MVDLDYNKFYEEIHNKKHANITKHELREAIRWPVETSPEEEDVSDEDINSGC